MLGYHVPAEPDGHHDGGGRICRSTAMNERQNLRAARMALASEGPTMRTRERDRSNVGRTDQAMVTSKGGNGADDRRG
jgi:hypothetical protein